MTKFIILHITSWAGSIGAEHLYCKLILVTADYLTPENFSEWSVSSWEGEEIELRREISLQEAMKLAKKDRGDRWTDKAKRNWENGFRDTDRFNTFRQCFDAAMNKVKEMNLALPLVFSYQGEKISQEEMKKLYKSNQ